MITTFPQFKRLEISDKHEVESFTQSYLPYSDYNFVSIFSWNTQNKTQISKSDNCLIIKFQDYITNEEFFSFLGTTDIDDTISKIISFAKTLKTDTTLRLIPEIAIQNIKNKQNFNIVEDIDNNDYILSVKELINLQGKKYRGKKNFINRFIKAYGERINTSPLNLNDEKIKSKILKLFYVWEESSDKIRKETNNELIAVKRLLSNSKDLTLFSIGIFFESELIGFSINENTQKRYGIIHFEKVDILYTGIFPYLKQQTAIYFEKEGCEIINYEQDLGIPGLRKAKQSWHPSYFLKKYTISNK